METKNKIVEKKERPKFSVAIQSDAMKKLISDTLGDKEIARAFTADIVSLVATRPDIQDCDFGTIVSAALTAYTLKLPLSKSLGFAHIVPYKDNKDNIKKAQLQIGWKGLVQLGQRSGAFEKLGVREVHDGEWAGIDEFGEDIFKFSHDCDNNKIIGYYAYFKLINGFSKTSYWTTEKCERHATRYSTAHRLYKGGANDIWSSNFDAMAKKTVLKNLLNGYAPMSVDSELKLAILADQSDIEDGDYRYLDNEQGKSTINLTDDIFDDTPSVEEETKE